jgi:hypothetical protein
MIGGGGVLDRSVLGIRRAKRVLVMLRGENVRGDSRAVFSFLMEAEVILNLGVLLCLRWQVRSGS